MRYIIVGAGAIGCSLGGQLHRGGLDTVLVARGAQHRALRAGLRLELPGRAVELSVPVVDRPEALSLCQEDILLLAVKTQDATAALDAWAGQPMAGGGTAAERLPVVCAQNGVAAERMALRRFRRVYGAYLWLPASYLHPGVVEVCCGPRHGVLRIGRYPSGTDALAGRIAADLAGCDFDGAAVSDVMRWKYGKLVSNVANALEALCGPITSARSRELVRLARAEATAVLAAAGIEHADEQEQAAARGDRVRMLTGRGGGSTWQSLARGTGTIEVDYLNGEVVLLGRLHGVATPVNELLQRLAEDSARAGRHPGELTADDLAARLATGLAQPALAWARPAGLHPATASAPPGSGGWTSCPIGPC